MDGEDTKVRDGVTEVVYGRRIEGGHLPSKMEAQCVVQSRDRDAGRWSCLVCVA